MTERRRALASSEEAVLLALQLGPVISFGSSREANVIVQKLRTEGKIRYVKVKDGGSGWELVK